MGDGDGVEFRVKSFDPLVVELPTGPIVGRVTVVLPPVHLQLYDLSMGLDLLAGAHIGGDMPIAGLSFDVGAEGIAPEKVVGFIHKAQAELRTIWQAYQDELDKRGALLSW